MQKSVTIENTLASSRGRGVRLQFQNFRIFPKFGIFTFRLSGKRVSHTITIVRFWVAYSAALVPFNYSVKMSGKVDSLFTAAEIDGKPYKVKARLAGSHLNPITSLLVLYQWFSTE